MIKSSGQTTFNRDYETKRGALHFRRTNRAFAGRLIAMVFLVLFLCPMTGSLVTDSPVRDNYQIQPDLNMQRWLLSEDTTYSGTGATQSVTLNGAFTNDTQGVVLIDSSTPTPVSISAPQDWTGTSLTGTMEQISTQFTPIKNGLLDTYHTERTIISGSPWNAMEYNVPDDWNIIEKGETYDHPYYGRLFFHSYSGDGREGSMGWRFSSAFGTTNAIYPDMEIYLTQNVQVPYRELYSAQVSIYYYVRSISSMNDYFYLLIRFGGYETQLHVFETGDATDQWIKQTVSVPMSAFESYPVPGSIDLEIGLGTDYSGLPSTAVDNQVYLDQVELVLEARPLPEQIGLSANQTIISGSTSGSVSPYVPDGAARDCFSRSDTGISTTSALEVGAWSSSGSSWDDVIKYQIGIQFPLDIPQGAIITYAALEVEALGYFGGGDNSLRVLVAEEDNVSPFTNGLPNLEDRYSWSDTSVAWILDTWENYYRYRTPDMSSIVQSVISRSGWDDGNYICIMIDYMNSDQYRDWNSIRGTYGYSGLDLATFYVDFLVPQEDDTISIPEYKKDLTIDHTKVSSDLEDFPVLVDIYDSDLKTDARLDGKDIKFTVGSEILDHEIELFDSNYNSTHAHLVAWVNVPQLSASIDTTVTMSYGAPDASIPENTHRIWDGYESVWHLSEQSGNGSFLEDSSQNYHDGTPGQTTLMQNAIIGDARYFQDAVGNYIPFIGGDSIFDGWSDFQFSFWIYFDYSSDAEWTGPEPLIFQKGTSVTLVRTFRGSSGWPADTASFQPDIHFDGYDAYMNVGVKRQTWNYIVYKYESSGDGTLRAYSFADGTLTESKSDSSMGSGSKLRDDLSTFMLGVDGGGQVHLGGIDEFRTMKGYKSAAWIQTEYANQYDPSGFLSVGTEQSVQYGQNATLMFTTNAPSVVSILPRMTLGITTQETTLDENMLPGTSFSVANGTDTTWTVNVLVSPPPGITDTAIALGYPISWTFQNVVDPLGNTRTSEVNVTATEVSVDSSVADTSGIWSFTFTSTNEVSNLECSADGSPYDKTAVTQPGQSMAFRGTAPIISGSAMRLTLVDPDGQAFYTSDDLTQDGSGRFEWSGIAVDGSWNRGTWIAYVDFNDTAGASPINIGRYSREFVVKHISSLDLSAPGDAVGDHLSVKTAGDLLLVEVNLTDTITLERVSGSTVTINWTVSGVPTQIQLEDYGGGSYGKALNTSDLGIPGMWRIEVQSSHPYLVDSSTYFDLALSHPTYISYATPKPTEYGDDFTVNITLYDAINGNPYPSATITSNGTLVGVPLDYGDGTYLVQIDSSGLELGIYCFQISASPTQSFVLDSATEVVFVYTRVRTQLIQIGVSPISIPWGRTVNATLEWQDIDHGGVGITGGLLSGDSAFEYTDLLDGTYSIQLDVSDYMIGTYLFNFTINKPYYIGDQITVAVTVVPHRTAIIASYNSSVSVGMNTSISLTYYDLDLGSTQIPGNFSSVYVEWAGGSSSFVTQSFLLEMEKWALGPHTINLTLFATTSPRYYYDSKTAFIVKITKLATELTWDPIESFPVGDDFEITLHLSVNQSGSLYDGSSIDGLDVSYINAQDKFGVPYTVKSFSFQGSGSYLLTIDQGVFSVNSYTIRIFVTFGGSENYTSTQTPVINFVYSEAQSELTSPDYPSIAIAYGTDATVTLEFVDIDRGQGIDTATVSVVGASEISEDLIGSGRYRVVIATSSWSIGTYVVNFTVSATNYEDKTISIEIKVREIRTYAIATVGSLDIPVGDTQIFYVDYKDLDHDAIIYPASGSCNWTLVHYDITWTGTRWKVTISTSDSDILGSYLLMFSFSAGPEYEMASFNVSVSIRAIQTELRLVTPAEATTASGEIQIEVYYGDRDHNIGIVSSYILCTVRNNTGTISIAFTNRTPSAPDGYYLISIDASQFGRLGSQQLTVIFNWTGSTQKYQDKFIATTAEIVGEDTELILVDAAPATECLDYMSYTFLYLDSSGFGITNDTSNVFINVEFIGLNVDLALVDILEVNSATYPGRYTIGFNNTILGRTGLFSMSVFINWSQNAWPYYTNRTDVLSVRVLPRDTLLSIVPPTSVPYGENATFSFTYEDITGGSSSSVEYDVSMDIMLSVPDFSFIYDSLEGIFTVSFNTSQLGAPLGERSVTLDLTWSGIPFYANKTGRVISVTITDRLTVLTYPTPPSTPYGDNVTFTIVITDVAGSTSRGVENVTLSLYDGAFEIPQSYLSVTKLGEGQYSVELDTSYYTIPNDYELTLVATPSAFYYQSKSSTRTLTVNQRDTVLIAEPPSSTTYNTSLRIVLQYLDLITLDPIANVSSPYVSVQVLNGSGWMLTCEWRPSMQNYLLIVETYNQLLDVGVPYQLWLNFSSQYESPFFGWADVLVSFQLQERATSLDLISTALPTPYMELANFTIEYKDVLSLSGIAGGTLLLYNGTDLLVESVHYHITTIGQGRYRISIDTSVLGVPSVKTVTVVAEWSMGAPYYGNATRNVSFTVNERPTNIDIVIPPTRTEFLENVTFNFIFKDTISGGSIVIAADDIELYNNGALLSTQDYSILIGGPSIQVSLNSTIISPTLVSEWNITITVSWSGGGPFYAEDRAVVYVTTVTRVGIVEFEQIDDTPFGNNITLDLTYYDQKRGSGIEGASILVSCLEYAGLVKNVDYWVTEGTGPAAGTYIIEVDSSILGGLGTYNFLVNVSWNPLISPYYENVVGLQAEAFVREIQSSISSELLSPSVSAFYQNISFTVSFMDIDHMQAIVGAEGSISIRYSSTGLTPSIWSVSVISDGVYGITVNLTDSLTTGLQQIVVDITIFPYQSVETQIVFGLRYRVGGLSADVPLGNYAGEPTYVTVYLTDEDSGSAPLIGASLVLTWADLSSYMDLGDGRYNITLYTNNLNFGIQSLVISASVTYYSISPLTVEIELLAVSSELIVTFAGPRPNSPLEIYWGEPVTIYAALNDTLRNQLIESATIYYSWYFGSDTFESTGIPGNYSAILDTSQGNALDTLIVTIEAQAPNYLNASAQISFQILPRLMEIIPDNNRYVFSVDWGGQASVVVYLEDSLNTLLIVGANVTAEWEFANLTLTEVPGQPGFYLVNIPVLNATFDTYEVQLHGYKENFRNASVTLILSVSQIHMVAWLDSQTASYEYTPVSWSELVSIGVYVLTPSLNLSDPYSTGLSDCIVTWFSPELNMNGTLLNGSSIGGAGYYYFYFNTTLSTASVHTFRISVTPPSSDYTYAENSTTILVQNIQANIQSEGPQDLVWGWNGSIVFTYYDDFHGIGVQADQATYSWAGGDGDFVYLGEGRYGLPVNTTTLRPGTYTVTLEFRKANYDDIRITVRIHIAPVPTEISILIPEIYQVGDSWSNLEVPYGEELTITLLYNNTNLGSGIANAMFNNSVYSGPGFFETPLILTDLGNGNYSFVFSSIGWDVGSPFSFTIQFMLENYTSAEYTFEITIIKVPTEFELDRPSVITLNWGKNTTIWIQYADSWPGHAGEGITDALITIDNPTPQYATVEYIGPDASRPGYYEFRVIARRISGVAEISIHINKTNYTPADVTLLVTVSPSAADIAMQRTITFGGAFIIILLIGAIVWVRIIKVPKIIRAISGQIRQLRRGKVPKPAKVESRQALVAQLFNELTEDIGLKKIADLMPSEPIVIEIPEIDELIVDLAILTGMTQEEVDDFRFEISKMKMSQQTSFVKEVINQELIRVAGVQNKSIEQVLQEVVAERRRRIGGDTTEAIPEVYGEIEKETEVSEPEDEEGVSYEHKLREIELEEMAEELEKRGIPAHEIESFVAQARELPKDVVEMLLQSFTAREKPEPVEEKVEHLSEEELGELRSALVKRGASDKEIESIIDQAKDLPRELALEFYKEPEESTKRKRKKKVKTLSKKERDDLQAELVRKNVPEAEIKAIMKEAETAPKERIEEFLESLEDTELEVPVEDVEFEDRLSDFELEDLRKELEKRNLPVEEINTIVKQARNLPKALLDDLLKSIDADLEARKK
jgi:hypothetical protein